MGEKCSKRSFASKSLGYACPFFTAPQGNTSKKTPIGITTVTIVASTAVKLYNQT